MFDIYINIYHLFIGHHEDIEEEQTIISKDVWEQIKILSEKENSDDVIELDVTSLSKDERTMVHQTVKRYFEKKIVSNSITKDDKKFVMFKKYNKTSKCALLGFYFMYILTHILSR